MECCRTPQVVRAAARVYIILLVPLFYGPYYAQVRQESASFAFALFFAMIVSTPLDCCPLMRVMIGQRPLHESLLNQHALHKRACVLRVWSDHVHTMVILP